jgi:hypothetical protein
MTSQINPATIDGNYPIAGVPNNTQGMRDNFTAIKTNFQYAETELDELQSKGVFKAALTGTTLDNNMGNNLIYNARIQGFSGTLVQIANTSGAITVDCSAGPVQTIVMGGNITVSFTTATWPAAGSVGIIRLIITVDTANRTLTLPANVSLGTTGVQGYSTNVITFAAAGTYEFGFLTYDQGTTITLFDYNRPLSYFTNDVTMNGNLTVSGDIFGNVTLTDITVNSVTATGNVVGGNVKTAGLISATGNITGGNVITANVNSTIHTGTTVLVSGNITGGNVLFGSGVISGTGNISGGNILGGANVNATLHTGTTVSVTGNVTGGNLITGAAISAASVSASANITGGNVLSGAVVSAVGAATILSGTAVPAGGTAGAGYKFSSTANLGVFFGSGAPTLSAAQGSLYLRTDGSSTSTRMYVNTNGSTTWTAVTTAT